MSKEVVCGKCLNIVAIDEYGQMVRHGLSYKCPGSHTSDFGVLVRSVKGWKKVKKLRKPAPGQVWRDLNSPGRTLTVNFLYQKLDGTWFAQCTSHNPNTRFSRRRTKITSIRADRFYTRRVWIRRAGEEDYRTVGFEEIELVDTWIVAT